MCKVFFDDMLCERSINSFCLRGLDNLCFLCSCLQLGERAVKAFSGFFSIRGTILLVWPVRNF